MIDHHCFGDYHKLGGKNLGGNISIYTKIKSIVQQCLPEPIVFLSAVLVSKSLKTLN